jgi:hypothetical protein
MRGYTWRSEEVLWKGGTSYDEHHETRDHFRPCLCWLGTVRCNDGHWFGNHVAAKCAHHLCDWAPIFFTIVSLIYFKKFNYTTPLQTALIFVGFVIAADFFVVALLMNRSLEMFANLLGTWIPFAFIFTSTYVTGWYTGRNSTLKTAAP